MSAEIAIPSEMLVAFAAASADLFIEINSDLAVMSVMGSCQALLGEPKRTMQGRDLSSFFSEKDKGVFKRIIKLCQGSGRVAPITLQLSSSGQRIKSVVVGASLIAPRVDRIYVSMRLNLFDESRVMGVCDDETGLIEHQRFLNLIEVVDGGDETYRPYDLYFIHLGGLKKASVHLPLGDYARLMRQIGDVMRSHSLGTFSAARLGTENFAILTKPNVPETFRKKLTNDLQMAVFDSGFSRDVMDFLNPILKITTSKSDLAQFRAQFEGVKCSSPSSGGLALNDNATSDRPQLNFDLFKIVFQPIFKLNSGSIDYYAAEASFKSNKAVVEAAKISKHPHLSCKIEFLICKAILENISESTNTPIEVSVSSISTRNNKFCSKMLGLLQMYKAVSKNIIFNIIDSNAGDDLTPVFAFASRLKNAGHRISFGNFTTSNSHYDYLRYIQFDYVKIDQAFLLESDSDPRQEQLVRSLCDVARSLGSEVVAKVDTKEAAATAVRLGIKYGQGFLFSHLPPIVVPMKSASRQDNQTVLESVN